MAICKICGKEFSSERGLSYHISHSHHISLEEYYLRYVCKDISTAGKCLVCGKPTNFISRLEGYCKTCSNECRNNLWKIKCSSKEKKLPRQRFRKFEVTSKLISREQLYDFYIVQNKSFSETAKYFNLSETELDYLLKGYDLTGIKKVLYSSEEASKRLSQTLTYDVVYKYFITEQHTIDECASKFKIKRTTFRRLAKYLNIKKSRSDSTATQKRVLMDTYGVENNFQLDAVKEKARKTLLQHYGVEHPLQNPEIYDKAIGTSVERYGEDFRLNWNNDSKTNQTFAEKLDKLGLSYTREFRVGNRFFDFKIGDFLIDINPTYTHNITIHPYNKGKSFSKDYHIEKRALGYENGYHVISIFEWINQDKVLNMFFGKKERVYARQCEIKQFYKEDFAKIGLKDFINRNHIQGYPRYGQESAVCLFYKDKLVAVQTWGKSRFNRNYKYELYRMVTDLNFEIVGGNAKMFAYFFNYINVNREPVLSYCDYNLFSGDVYIKNGFRLLSIPKPTRHWVYIGKKVDGMTDRQRHFTDNLIRQNGFDRLLGKLFGTYGKGTSNAELLKRFKYVEVYDCGQATYVIDCPQENIN